MQLALNACQCAAEPPFTTLDAQYHPPHAHRSLVRHDPRKLPQGQISMGQIRELVAARAFPLCMTTMYQRLTSEHHLKHYGRMQFNLFLKAIGLPLEQALLFFRQQFAPR